MIFAVRHGHGCQFQVVQLIVVLQPFQREGIPQYGIAVADIGSEGSLLHVIVWDGEVFGPSLDHEVMTETVFVYDEPFLSQLVNPGDACRVAFGRKNTVCEETNHIVAIT